MRTWFKLTEMEKAQREVGFHTGIIIGLLLGTIFGITIAGWLGAVSAICHF